MDLCLIDPFANQYVADEITISTMLEAANYTAIHGPDNGLGSHIENHLDVSKDFKEWVRSMPSKRPKSLKTYQTNYAKRLDHEVTADILSVGKNLSIGQTLLHAGLWVGGSGRMVTTRPLSTTFSPIVAFMNAIDQGKAYEANRIDFFVLTITSPNIRGFVFGPRGDLSHEYEVLLPAGLILTPTKDTLWHTGRTVGGRSLDGAYNCKDVPVHVIELDVTYLDDETVDQA